MSEMDQRIATGVMIGALFVLLPLIQYAARLVFREDREQDKDRRKVSGGDE